MRGTERVSQYFTNHRVSTSIFLIWHHSRDVTSEFVEGFNLSRCDELKREQVCLMLSVFSFYFIKALDLPFGMAFAVPNFCLSYRNEPFSKECNRM